MGAGAFRDTASARNAVAVDASTADDVLPAGCRGLYIGVTGDVEVTLINSGVVVFTAAPVGILPVQATTVHTTNTTATDIVALF
jgi:hypothetical protein